MSEQLMSIAIRLAVVIQPSDTGVSRPHYSAEFDSHGDRYLTTATNQYADPKSNRYADAQWSGRFRRTGEPELRAAR